jgi:hypothetical protein
MCLQGDQWRELDLIYSTPKHPLQLAQYIEVWDIVASTQL